MRVSVQAVHEDTIEVLFYDRVPVELQYQFLRVLEQVYGVNLVEVGPYLAVVEVALHVTTLDTCVDEVVTTLQNDPMLEYAVKAEGWRSISVDAA